jgi:hypothetical protein
MLMSINFFLYSLFFLFAMITGCVSFDRPITLKPDDSSIGGMVLQSINVWQNMRGVGVNEGVKNSILNEYIASTINCRTHLQSIDRPTIEFYIFQYLDSVQEGGPYSAEFICNPFAENIKRKQNRYRVLKIDFNSGTDLLINNELFDVKFNSFILTKGEYDVRIRSNGKVICRRLAKIESNSISRISCKSPIS